MTALIRNPKDFWTGAIFLLVGSGAVIIGQDYAMGSAVKMGPAYFPTVLGGLLALIGLIAIIRSLLTSGTAIGAFVWREVVLVLAAILLFGVLVRGAGLVTAVVVLVLMSAYASIKFRWTHALLLAAGLAVFTVLVFVKALGLPISLFGPWFGF